ncbi:bifunctional DNA primase/polymerase [Citromicrobium phage vB_CbaS-RXM]|nr:bifunctional DNA primase/polymerase [Citromicrobium phage vB_CbaS-RXM]
MTLDPILDQFLSKFGGAPVRVEFSDGTEFVSASVDEIVDACVMDAKLDPWIDLVDGTGIAHGLSLPGNPDVVEPAPSYVTDDAAIFMFQEGVTVEGEKQGKHMVPVAEIMSNADAPRYSLDDMTISTPGSEIEITLSQGRHRMEKQGGWKAVRSVFGQFSDILQVHQQGKKDGPCFLQGEAAGGTRKAMAMIANYIIGVDLDSGKPLDEVMGAIIDAGLEAVIYTTHSHMKNTSQIKRDHFLKWTDGEEPTPELVAEYLQVKKGMIPEVTRNIEIVNDAHHTEEGVVILVQHDPVPKFRAVFPLSEAFVFAKRGGPQKDAITEWKERYAGFATAMGFFFDETCADPARLFYLPRHAKDKPHGSWWIAGEPVNLDNYDRIKVKRDRRSRAASGPSNPWSDQASDDDDDDVNRYMIGDFNLVAWARENAKVFECESFLTELVHDAIREERSGKPGVHVECPFEAEHSTFGGGGCFVVNSGDNWSEGFEGGFTFTCVHDACSHRDRLDMLKGAIEEGWFTVEDLKKTVHKQEIEEEEEVERPTPTPSPSPAPTPAKAAPKYEEPVDESDLDEEERNLRYFNRNYAVCATTGGARILVEQPEDEEDDIVFYTQSDVALIEKGRFVFVPGKGGKTERLDGFKLWLEHPDRRFYRRVIFAPGRETDPQIYNLFRGFPVQPVKGDWSLLRDHLYENICESNPELFDWFMTWMAHMIQKPSTKPGSTIVVSGNKGTGKSTLFEYLGKLTPRNSITVSQRKQIVGNFNAHIATALLMICEEAFWASDPQAESALKDLITAREMMIEKKGHDPIKSENFTRIVFISNSDHVVPASLGDERRFGVFRCSDARRGDIPFFEALRRQMDEEGGLEAMMYELLHYEPKTGSFGCLFTPPQTEHLKQQQIQSLTGLDRFMLDLIRAGVYEPSNENIDTIDLEDDKPTRVWAQNLRACVEDYVRFKFPSDKARTTYEDIAAAAIEWFGASETHVKEEGMQNRRRLIVFPPLTEARAELEERKGVTIQAIENER